jgi:2-polyprenyl-3-methyl-5-hydroxy-6-metoxy-1,4-benzoquinol methylase
MKQVLLFLFLIIICVQLFYVIEGFNNLSNLNFNDIKTVKLNANNIDTDEPLFCFQNYCLHLKNDIYSLYDKSTMLTHTKYHKDTKECDFVYLNTILKNYPKNVNRVCIFGFGLGGLPLALSKNNNINKIDCVDIEMKMFEVFKTINPNPPKKINYYLYDVNEYIKQSDQKYDMIVDDTYSTEKIIVDYSSLKKMLVPNGILFINIINYDASLKLAEELKKTYKNVSHQRVNFNYLITCYRGSGV